ncbi:MAG: trimeric intracellular cation channel family protein [Proteiniphilum sp.]|uniref:trimeric intracellular cation channel family protein n=1 Tax=Proteiniphilum sp. TaxID=1926877 RepID=UPI002ABAA656|nr:trimeric intracellular cation channel family protein [Proteiniphilum sp.]MDY9918764.1 trimeric intracellular cation channel family protein [Proteiniphilum sp.]
MLFSVLDIIGTIAFAISGTLTAIEKRFDIFGIAIIAAVTAIGGGTLRDMLIGNTPVMWLQHLEYLYIVIATIIVTIFFRKSLNKLRKSLLLFDTIGIGIFTLIGIQKGLLIGLHPIVCVLLGTVTACFGGVIRDTLCNDVPIIFKKEIYATACIIGGGIFFLTQYWGLTQNSVYLATIISIITIRLFAVRLHWSLPVVKL